ncbi:hypothetical protein [Nocardia sp. NPDC004750]
MIVSVFEAVTNLQLNLLADEFDFLQSLISKTPQQAGQVNGFFSALMLRLEDGWRQTDGPSDYRLVKHRQESRGGSLGAQPAVVHTVAS